MINEQIRQRTGAVTDSHLSKLYTL